ncbi:hypothetical protein QZH41_000601 [Actinostola sp. cb2023]|nr:hypothetical protein QZH41_000601 [Actinostola sp. cb2023]
MVFERNFEWTREHEKIFVREILVQEPFAHPKGSLARGKIWGSIADMLNDLKYPVFRVQKRSVREKFNSLQQKYKSKMRKEKGASGIDVPPPTEVEQALEEITEKEEESILEENEKKEKSGQEKRKADDIRLKAMERMGETKKRKGEESENEETTRKKSRRSGSDTVNFLREKMAVESEARREEMQIKHQEQERWSAMFD